MALGPAGVALLVVIALAGALRLAWVLYAKTEPVWFFDPWQYDRLAAALGAWTLMHLVFFGEPRFHLPVTPVMAILAAPVWLWVGDVLRRPVVSRWRAFRPPAASEGDRAAASQP